MENSRGIVLLALGHTAYGRMAHTLAVSLKHTDPDCRIALIHNHESLRDLHWYGDLARWFEYRIPAPKESYISNGEVFYLKCKTWLNDLSPFDETLFLDADTLWLPQKKVSDLFAELNKPILPGMEPGMRDFTMANHGFCDTSVDYEEGFSDWCNLSDVKARYGPGKIYGLHSEFIYWKKSEANTKYFNRAKELFDNIGIPHRYFAGGVPDELPFAIAGMEQQHFPHEAPYLPTYWPYLHKRKQLNEAQIYKDYYLLSVGGATNERRWFNLYNTLAAFYFQNTKLQHPYKAENKRSFLRERQMK